MSDAEIWGWAFAASLAAAVLVGLVLWSVTKR